MEKYPISLCCFTRSSLTIVLWKKLNVFLCEFKSQKPVFVSFTEKIKFFLIECHLYGVISPPTHKDYFLFPLCFVECSRPISLSLPEVF